MDSSVIKKIRDRDEKFLEAMRELPCLGCGSIGPSEIHHLRSRGSGGDDSAWNVVPLDRKCHQKIHSLGLSTFLESHNALKDWMLSMGWYYEKNRNKWRHDFY